MTTAGLLTYSGALFVAAAIPGPGVASLVARALGQGFTSAFAMLLGLICGDLVYLTAAIFGLAVVAQTFGTAFMVIKYLGVAYLVYTGWKIWTAGVFTGDVVDRSARQSLPAAALSGLLVTLGNPKPMLFYLALLPVLIDLSAVSALNYLEMVVATFVVLLASLIPYIALAARARTFLTRPKSLRALNRGAAACLFGAATVIALKS